jgi:HK97 gp10 family phage protein
MLEMTLDLSRFTKSLNDLNLASKQEAKKAITMVSFKVEGDCKENISRGSRSGKTYKRGKNRTHQASASGEFPKTDRGALVSSITSQFDFTGLESTVGSRLSAPHGFWLEFGTAKMGARPWLSRTINENKEFINKSFESALSKIASNFK